ERAARRECDATTGAVGELGHELRVARERITAEFEQRRFGVVQLGDRRQHAGCRVPRAARGARICERDLEATLRAPPGDGGADGARADDGDVGRVLAHCSLAPALPGSGSTVGFRPLSPCGLPCSTHLTLRTWQALRTPGSTCASTRGAGRATSS